MQYFDGNSNKMVGWILVLLITLYYHQSPAETMEEEPANCKVQFDDVKNEFTMITCQNVGAYGESLDEILHHQPLVQFSSSHTLAVENVTSTIESITIRVHGNATISSQEIRLQSWKGWMSVAATRRNLRPTCFEECRTCRRYSGRMEM